jgi:hypothetical protein
MPRGPFIGPILVIAATAALSLATFDDWSMILAAPWGAVGAMIAVPLLILLYTFGQHIPVLSPLATLVGPTEGDVDDEIDEAGDSRPDSPGPGRVQAAAMLSTSGPAGVRP